ncbi:hypothetical protein DFH07DRAFT_766830 [Mycena maculata]|uniref:Uncharacterized protein n=1 Tax=Mycena maculata TaxID=230809 RepID=A0AAD7NUL1_9AGAR|nr:hypothetical protein DFH07DRAFT_766830 [Mycena maculata]
MALALEKSRLDFIGGFPSFAKYNTAVLGLLIAEICRIHHQVEDLSFRRSHIFHHEANARGISEIQHWATEARILSAEIRMLARRGLKVSEESSGGEAAEVSASVATHHAPDSRAIKPYHMQSSALVLSPPTSLSTHSQMDAFHALLPTLTPAENKALKKWSEAIRNEGRADTPLLKAWLEHYGVPSRTPACRGPEFHEHKHAALVARVVARKARVNALMDLRRRTLEASARKWPRPRCHKHNKENQPRDEVRLREQEKAAKEAAREERTTAARVAHLMALRAGVPYGYPIGIGDGESVESAWALTATPGGMGPGIRRDKLDDGYAEWSHLISTNRVHMPNK